MEFSELMREIDVFVNEVNGPFAETQIEEAEEILSEQTQISAELLMESLAALFSNNQTSDLTAQEYFLPTDVNCDFGLVPEGYEDQSAQVDPRTIRLYKTRFCSFGIDCPYRIKGRCIYAHSKDEIRSRPPPPQGYAKDPRPRRSSMASSGSSTPSDYFGTSTSQSPMSTAQMGLQRPTQI
jgi:hypothetical protein